MKSFREYLSEEVVPTALSDGAIDIANKAVRDEINGILSYVTSKPCVTPYNTLQKVRKALAYFHIHLPKRSYMEGGQGVEVWEIHQFGDKMGMNDQGEFIKSTPCEYYLFFRYQLMGSMFFVTAKIVDKEELDKHVSDAEKMMSEEHGAESHQMMAKARAPKEPMHDVTSDPKKSGNKKAVSVSQKAQIDEISKETVSSHHEKAKKQMVGTVMKAQKKKPSKEDIATYKKRAKGFELGMKKMSGQARVPANEELKFDPSTEIPKNN